jgi:hypothetical protein
MNYLNEYLGALKRAVVASDGGHGSTNAPRAAAPRAAACDDTSVHTTAQPCGRTHPHPARAHPSSAQAPP